jgi:hypothetical protein
MSEKYEQGMTPEAFRWMEAALGIAAGLNEALRPLIPKDPASLAPEVRRQWQQVVNAIFAGAEHADKMPACLKTATDTLSIQKGNGDTKTNEQVTPNFQRKADLSNDTKAIKAGYLDPIEIEIQHIQRTDTFTDTGCIEDCPACEIESNHRRSFGRRDKKQKTEL